MHTSRTAGTRPTGRGRRPPPRVGGGGARRRDSHDRPPALTPVPGRRPRGGGRARVCRLPRRRRPGLRLRLRRSHGPGRPEGWVLGGAGVVVAGAAGVGAAGLGFVRGRAPLTSPYSRFIVSIRVTASLSRAGEIAPDLTAVSSARNAAAWPRFVPEM